MKINRYLREAIDNVLNAKLRSFLTILGVFVGTASVVALLSGGRLATEHALAQLKVLGTDLLAVSIEEAEFDRASEESPDRILQVQDIDKIAKSSVFILGTAAYTLGSGSISYEGFPLQGNVIGGNRSLQKMIKIELAQGRFVSSYDDFELFCVIGEALAKNLKLLGVLHPIGKQIKVENYYFTIVGVAKPWVENLFMYADINNSILIPIETSLLLNRYTQIRNIIFRLAPKTPIEKVEQNIQASVQRILPTKKLFFRSAKELVNSMEKQSQALTLFLVLIGGISLIVGGIGVMNIMLVSVIERKREIGVRMAVGARKKDIQRMFLTEAIVLTLFGGILGILMGEAISFLTAYFSKWTFHLFLFPPFAGFLVSVSVGLFFGFYPAYLASKLDPIETLRAD